MPDPAWPGSLPQYPLMAGYNETEPDTLIETAMETGVPKARQRFTAGTRPIQCSVKLQSQAQKDALSTFYRVTLAGGALPFTWAGLSAPTTGGTGRFRIAKPPSYSRSGADRWLAQLAIIRLP